MSSFNKGLKLGIPIAMGYIPVSFTFGLMAVQGGLSPWIAVLISLTNLTSAGQFAGTSLIISGGTLPEITLTTFVINIRYMLMSLSLSQKIVPNMPLAEKAVMSFGITDETFSVASLEKEDITFSYMLGIITLPYFGWAFGTLLGASASSLLPQDLKDSMGIALYAMLIALVVPASKKSKAALTVAVVAIAINSMLTWVPYINSLSSGWDIIISTVVACIFGAAVFPAGEVD